MPLVTRSSQNASVWVGDSAPSNPIDGDLFSDKTNNKLQVYDGSSFNDVGTSSFSGAAVITHSTTIGDYTQPSAAVSSSQDLGTIDLDEDFTGYATQGAADSAWVSADTGANRVDITNDDISWTISRGTNDAISYDLTSVSDTSWVLRFRVRWASIPDNANNQQWWGISSVSSSTASNGTHDFLGLMTLKFGSGAEIRSSEADGSSLDGSADFLGTHTRSTDTWYYYQITRLSATQFKVTLSSTDSFNGDLEDSGSLTCASTIQNLRYIWFGNENAGSGTGGSCEVKDVQFWDSISSTSNLVDDDTATNFATSSETNPNVYVDMGSATNLCGVAIYHDGTNTTETELLIQTSADASTWTTKRTITESNLTDNAWNYIRFNVANARYLRIYGNSGSSVVLSMDEIKVLSKTSEDVLSDLGVLEISSSDTTIGLDGI